MRCARLMARQLANESNRFQVPPKPRAEIAEGRGSVQRVQAEISRRESLLPQSTAENIYRVVAAVAVSENVT